ncbi:MAG: hypothetical protein KGQ93_01270 [Cyanobacteria bacterium REEB459]|nr:hypothetical protein [Cyanobacteria bacterium REEB459]
MNSAVALTLILLSLMIGTGVISASWGFTAGSQALSGIRQPDARPANAAAMNREAGAKGQGFAKESDILAQVKVLTSGGER